jgi:hypothetical protein
VEAIPKATETRVENLPRDGGMRERIGWQVRDDVRYPTSGSAFQLPRTAVPLGAPHHT